MGEIYTIPIEKLVPGLVLAEDIRHAQTGVVLIPSGTPIDERHLARLKYFRHAGEEIKCMVPEPPGVADVSSPAIETGIKPLPLTVDETTRKIYIKAFETTKKFFSKYKNIEYADIQAIKAVAENISAQIVRNPAILSHVAILKAIDSYTFSHSVNVAIYAAALAHFLGHSTAEINGICLAGLLHDIGKLDIPRKIVEKPGPLTEDEYKIMQKHALLGYLRLKKTPHINENVLAAVSQHHEKIDGSGYYRGLKGDEIHPWAIILAVADVYDALTTDRVYRTALLPHEGAEILMASCSLNHLEFNAVKFFTEKIPFYPPGTRVVLNTGEIGYIMAYHVNTPLCPIVNINREGKGSMIDLSRNHTVMITRIIR